MSATIAQSGLVFASAPVRHSLASSDVPASAGPPGSPNAPATERPLAAPAAEELHGEEADDHHDDRGPS